MTQDDDALQYVEHPGLGRLEVLDDSDPSLLTVRSANGNTLRIGKRAVGWPVPEYTLAPARRSPGLASHQPAQETEAPAEVTPGAAGKTQRALPHESPTQSGVPALHLSGNNRKGRFFMDAKSIEFKIERETKNTVRYEEETSGQPPTVGTLYVQKWALGTPVPPRLKVTIEAGE